MNPKWLPDGSGIGANSLQRGTIIQAEYGDVIPPRPDPRVEVVARALAAKCGSDAWEVWADDARSVLAALDAMGADQ